MSSKDNPGLQCSVFANKSVNLVTCASNSGKTRLVTDILLNREAFFEAGSGKQIVYINCNVQNNQTRFENPFLDVEDTLPPLAVYNLLEIDDVNSIVEGNEIVILDDVVFLNDIILYFITYAANHLNVVVFVITQSCLSNKLFELIYKVHTVTLIFKNSSSVRLAQHLLSHFFLATETKSYLKNIFALAQQRKHVLILKLNTIASSSKTYKSILAFGNIEQLFHPTNKYCIVFPEVGDAEELASTASLMDLQSSVDGNDFVLIQAKHVKDTTEATPTEKVCSKQSQWQQMNESIRTEIQSTFPVKKWSSVLNLFREILRVKEFCISNDFRQILIRNHKKSQVSIIDFLTVATRRSHSKEGSEKYSAFVPFVRLLLKIRVPISYIKNAKLVEFSTATKQPHRGKL